MGATLPQSKLSSLYLYLPVSVKIRKNIFIIRTLISYRAYKVYLKTKKGKFSIKCDEKSKSFQARRSIKDDPTPSLEDFDDPTMPLGFALLPFEPAAQLPCLSGPRVSPGTKTLGSTSLC